jgi:hypothetical protein
VKWASGWVVLRVSMVDGLGLVIGKQVYHLEWYFNLGGFGELKVLSRFQSGSLAQAFF